MIPGGDLVGGISLKALVKDRPGVWEGLGGVAPRHPHCTRLVAHQQELYHSALETCLGSRFCLSPAIKHDQECCHSTLDRVAQVIFCKAQHCCALQNINCAKVISGIIIINDSPINM